MLSQPIWQKLTDEQCKLLGSPSDETFTWMVEAHRNMLANRSLEAAILKQFEKLEVEKLAIYEMAREARKCEQAARASLVALLNRGTEFVSEITRLLQSEGLRLCEQNPAEVQAVIDRFHDHLADYQ